MQLVESRPEVSSKEVTLLERCGALLFGDFKLSSGQKSDYYFDSKRLTLDPEGAAFVAEQLVGKVREEGVDIVLGTAYGGIPIASHICIYSRLSEGAAIPAFYIRKEAIGKGHGTNKPSEGTPPALGQRVAIVEDVVTSGKSLLQAVDAFEKIAADEGWEYELAHAIALVDRGEGGREKIEARGYRFWSLFTVEREDGGRPKFRFNGFSA